MTGAADLGGCGLRFRADRYSSPSWDAGGFGGEVVSGAQPARPARSSPRAWTQARGGMPEIRGSPGG